MNNDVMTKLQGASISAIGKKPLLKRAALMLMTSAIAVSTLIAPNNANANEDINVKLNSGSLSELTIEKVNRNNNRDPLIIVSISSQDELSQLNDITQNNSNVVEAFVTTIDSRIKKYNRSSNKPDALNIASSASIPLDVKVKGYDNDVCVVTNIQDSNEKSGWTNTEVGSNFITNHEKFHCKTNLAFLSNFMPGLEQFNDSKNSLFQDTITANSSIDKADQRYLKHLEEIYADIGAITSMPSNDRLEALHNISDLRNDKNSNIEHANKAVIDYLIKHHDDINWLPDSSSEVEKQNFAEQLMSEVHDNGMITEASVFIEAAEKIEEMNDLGRDIGIQYELVMSNALTSNYDQKLMHPNVDANSIIASYSTEELINITDNSNNRNSVLQNLIAKNNPEQKIDNPLEHGN